MTLLEQARENVAARQEARGDAALAEQTRAGEEDWCWAMYHELAKLEGNREGQGTDHGC